VRKVVMHAHDDKASSNKEAAAIICMRGLYTAWTDGIGRQYTGSQASEEGFCTNKINIIAIDEAVRRFIFCPFDSRPLDCWLTSSKKKLCRLEQ